MSTVGYEEHPPINCFDGKLDNMCHSVQEENPWLSIKFPKSYWINKVSVVNRVTCGIPGVCAPRFKEAVVMVGSISPSANNQIFTDGTQLGAKFPGGLAAGATHEFVGDQAVWGNVVTVQLQSLTHLHLAEVSVFYQEKTGEMIM